MKRLSVFGLLVCLELKMNLRTLIMTFKNPLALNLSFSNLYLNHSALLYTCIA